MAEKKILYVTPKEEEFKVSKEQVEALINNKKKELSLFFKPFIKIRRYPMFDFGFFPSLYRF
jgi:hypothetical protein